MLDTSVSADPLDGPYAGVLEAITAYRRLARAVPAGRPDTPAMDCLKALICIYAVGIVRGDGLDITAFANPAPAGGYADHEPF